MRNHSALACIVALLLGSIASGEECEIATIELSSPRVEYLLGEPVLLDVVVRSKISGPFEGTRTLMEDIRILVGCEEREPFPIDQGGFIGERGQDRGVIEPGEAWTYHLRALRNYYGLIRGQSEPKLAFPEIGRYKIRVRYPLYGSAAILNRRVTADRYYPSNTIEIHVREPEGDDVAVFEAISDEKSRDFLLFGYREPADWHATAAGLAHLLKDNPETGYRDAILRPLADLYRRILRFGDRNDPDRELIRVLLREPDDRVGPDDARLDKIMTLDFPEPTSIARVFATLQEQSSVPLGFSPGFAIQSPRLFLPDKKTLRDIMYAVSVAENTSWARRGDGYYLYAEMTGGAQLRKAFGKLIGPTTSPFPDDKRLNSEVVADFPDTTPMDEVLSSYSKQAGIPLEASPFLHRCRQSGERMTLDLGEEMGYLARTFRAEWKRRDDGYYLDAGADADRVALPPEAVRPPEVKNDKGDLRGWFALGTAGLLAVAALGWARSRQVAPRPAASTASKV